MKNKDAAIIIKPIEPAQDPCIITTVFTCSIKDITTLISVLKFLIKEADIDHKLLRLLAKNYKEFEGYKSSIEYKLKDTVFKNIWDDVIGE